MAGAFFLQQSDSEAGGRPAVGTPAHTLSAADCAKVEAEACRKPSDVGIPVTHWSPALLGVRSQGIEISDSSIRRILKSADLKPHLQKMWLTSQDDEFRAKRDDILQVYYDSPKHEHIICLDEQTGIQALERRYADIPMKSGQPVRREFEYVRHGTLCLMGAFDVRRGKLFGFTSDDHDATTFVELLDLVDTCYPDGRGHLIMDNLSAHDTDDVLEWLDEHPRWKRHFTPKHASWLNQIECMLGIMRRRVIVRGSFTSTDDLRARLYDYMLWHDATDQPFQWSYRPKSWSLNYAPTSGERN